MSGKIEISRDLAEQALRFLMSPGDGWEAGQIAQELRAILAAPVVERQPVAFVLTRDDEVCYEADDGIVISNTPGDETNLYKWKPVYFDTSPPAPAVQDEMVTIFKDILGWADSNTTWSEIEYRIRACLDKVKELNQ